MRCVHYSYTANKNVLSWQRKLSIDIDRSDIARIVKGYHSFTCTPCISSASSINGISAQMRICSAAKATEHITESYTEKILRNGKSYYKKLLTRTSKRQVK